MTHQGIEATGAPGSGCSRGRSTGGAARPSSTTKKTGLSDHHQYIAQGLDYKAYKRGNTYQGIKAASPSCTSRTSRTSKETGLRVIISPH